MKGRKREAPQGRNTQREGDPPRVGNWGQEEQRALCRAGLSRVQGVLQPCSLLRYMLPTSLTLSPSTLLSLHPRQTTGHVTPSGSRTWGKGGGFPLYPMNVAQKQVADWGPQGSSSPLLTPL